MIVPLTGPQWNAVAQRIPVEWKEAMKEHRTHNYGRSHNYDLPMACWRAVFEHLQAQAIGPQGGFTMGPEALYSAISRMMRGILEAEQHPALTPGLHVTGWRSEIVPVWDTRPTRSCYPAEASFVLLIPWHVTQRGWKLTTWSASYDNLVVTQSCSHSEDVQLVLAAQFGVGGIQLRSVPQD